MEKTLSSVFVILVAVFNVLAMALIWLYKDFNLIYHLMMGVTAIGFIAIAIVPESPAFLLKKHRFKELNAVLRQIGRMNYARADERVDFFPESDQINRRDTHGDGKTPSLAALCRNEDER